MSECTPIGQTPLTVIPKKLLMVDIELPGSTDFTEKYTIYELDDIDQDAPEAPSDRGYTLLGAEYLSVGWIPTGDFTFSANNNPSFQWVRAMEEAKKCGELVNVTVKTKQRILFKSEFPDAAAGKLALTKNATGDEIVIGQGTKVSAALLRRGAAIIKAAAAWTGTPGTISQIGVISHFENATDIVAPDENPTKIILTESTASTISSGDSVKLGIAVPSHELASFACEILQFDSFSWSGEGAESSLMASGKLAPLSSPGLMTLAS